MASITKLPSGSWRAQVRRNGRYVSKTFKRRRDADEWTIDMERRIDRGESVSKSRPKHLNTLIDLVDLHLADMHESRKPLRRSKSYSLNKLKQDIGHCGCEPGRFTPAERLCSTGWNCGIQEGQRHVSI